MHAVRADGKPGRTYCHAAASAAVVASCMRSMVEQQLGAQCALVMLPPSGARSTTLCREAAASAALLVVNTPGCRSDHRTHPGSSLACLTHVAGRHGHCRDVLVLVR